MKSRKDAPRWLYWLYQAVMVSLALLVVWLITLPDSPPVHQANLTIWAVFLLDYLVRLIRSPDRRHFARNNIPDLLALVPLDFITEDDQFGLIRLLRLARFIRLVRAGAVLWRVNRNLRDVLKTNGLAYVLLFTLSVIGLGGVAIWLAEPRIKTVGDGVWWSLVTTATVGYGDIAPSTLAGRIVAAILMIVGISTFGLVTSAMTTHFLHHRRVSDPHVGAVIAQLEQWDRLSPAERSRAAGVLQVLVDQDLAGHDRTTV